MPIDRNIWRAGIVGNDVKAVLEKVADYIDSTLQGPQGPQGAAGPQGPQGPQG